MASGIRPSSRLELRRSLCNRLPGRNSDTGISPERALSLRSRWLSCGSSPSSGGIGPLRLVPDSTSIVNDGATAVRLLGTRPIRSRYCRLIPTTRPSGPQETPNHPHGLGSSSFQLESPASADDPLRVLFHASRAAPCALMAAAALLDRSSSSRRKKQSRYCSKKGKKKKQKRGFDLGGKAAPSTTPLLLGSMFLSRFARLLWKWRLV
ncbi:hypothetical protein IEQ34_001323 [Dendrobium chrysotoxum]|uniref:Uncharacterized protein n=1 Tax=Dendrobium chrysotoxum TaxID=161865 RepID=A0AAV7HNS7_DENCH|nr:hypothetical protein IEQ34_001323 [Dendrobium chrysotoxum]